MNDIFKEHVTSSAFSLTLSKSMIRRLLMMDYHPAFYFDGQPHNLKTLDSLRERGLVYRDEKEFHVPGKGTFLQSPLWRFTEEGELVVKLLKAAGFTLEHDAQLKQIVEFAEAFTDNSAGDTT